jgi:ribosome-associated protein
LTSRELAIEAARAADDKKASEIRVMDIGEKLGITDFFVVCSGNTERQVHRIQDAVEERLRGLGVKPARREGERFRLWVLLDYGDFVVHIFREEERQFYNIERLWRDVEYVPWEPDSAVRERTEGESREEERPLRQ